VKLRSRIICRGLLVDVESTVRVLSGIREGGGGCRENR